MSKDEDMAGLGGDLGLIRSEVGEGDFQFQEILAVGQVQSAGRDGRALALLQDVGDVFAAISFESEGILEGVGDLINAVDFAQGHDFLDMVGSVEPFLVKFADIELGLGRQIQERQQEGLLTGFEALGQQFLGVIRIVEVLVALVPARVSGDECFLMIDAEAIG